MKSSYKVGFLVAAIVAIGAVFSIVGGYAAADKEKSGDSFVVGEDIYDQDMVMESVVIPSKNIDSKIRIDISYIKGTERLSNLPAVYMTDGHWRRIDHKYIHYLSKRKLIPPVLVVGVGYVEGADIQRIRITDLVVKPEPFLTALRDEVIPLVEKRFSCDQNKRILLGASAGGFFSVYSFFENLSSNRVVFTGFVGSSAYFPSLDPSYFCEGVGKFKGNVPVYLYLSYGGQEDISLPALQNVNDRISAPNKLLFDTIEKLAVKNLVFVHRFNPETDHYTNTRVTYVEGTALAFANGPRVKESFRDLSYGTFHYDFNSPSEMYDWESSGAVRQMTYAAKDPSSGGSGCIVMNGDFAHDDSGRFGTTFDHFEDLYGKTISFRLYVPQTMVGKCTAVFTLASTYNWKEDIGEPVTIDK
ncbi:MAG TPA: alpha/beta hydrolase-fold protein, partial [Spirochaetota bacterium]